MSEHPSTGEAPAVRLRPATQDDWHVIRRWLAQPDVIRWWGPKATSEAEVMLAMGSAQAICRMIEVSVVAGAWLAVGYAQALDTGLSQDVRVAGIDAGTWQIELFVASPDFRGRGVGAAAVGLIRDEVFGTTLALGAAAFVAIGNEKAVRAYEQAGFRWHSICRDAARGPAWLMIVSRDEALQAAGAGLTLS